MFYLLNYTNTIKTPFVNPFVNLTKGVDTQQITDLPIS